jgi:flagellar basal-body rod protein FlgC
MSKGLFEAIRISATGLRGQRLKLDVVARNLANAETTRTTDGTPYRRQRAIFQEILERQGGRLQRLRGSGDRSSGALSRTHSNHLAGLSQRLAQPASGVTSTSGTALDASDFRVVYDPGHPDADNEGYVLLPNVNPIEEMVDMITASRAYEANVSAVQAAKEMFLEALKI